jgi:HD-GYP domain-containing protein (c-di-GMP phosphodiesterase class II)
MQMIADIDTAKNSVILEIKKKIRLIILVASFVIVTLFGIIFLNFYKNIFPFFDFFSEVPIAVIIIFTLMLAFLGLYLTITLSSQTLRITQDYSLRLDRLLHITKDLREEIYGDILLEKIMDYALSITNSDAGSLLLMENGNNLVFKILRGEQASQLLGKTVEAGKGLTGWAAERGLPVRIDDVSKDDRFSPEYDTLTGYKTKTIMCIPLKIKDKVIGVLVLLNKKDGHPYRPRDEEIITYLADQAAISIMKTKFVEDQKNYEIHLTEILLEAIDSQLSDKKGHSKRVARYSNILGKALNIAEEAQRRLYFASLLHDVGFLKMRVSGDVFDKAELMRHPVVGYEMIKPINFYSDIAPYILHHHERYDGYGYPSQLKGEEIPLVARIISIAEAFDAMTSPKSYKIQISFEDALEELKNNAGTQFDPDLVNIFVENITQKHTQ